MAGPFQERIVYLGMTLVPSVTELVLAQLLYLQYDDPSKPIYFYINSTGTTKNGEKLGYEAEVCLFGRWGKGTSARDGVRV